MHTQTPCAFTAIERARLARPPLRRVAARARAAANRARRRGDDPETQQWLNAAAQAATEREHANEQALRLLDPQEGQRWP